MNCPSCTRPTADGLVCAGCVKRLRDDLTALPGYMEELATTIRRQSHTGDGSGGRTHETPMAFDWDAATVRDSVINTIGTWIRELDLGDTTNLAPNMRAWCNWLADRTQRIRGHAAAEEIIDEIHYITGVVRQAVDSGGDSVYCGKCAICKRDIRASADAEQATCRFCWIGGTVTVVPVPRRTAFGRANAWRQAENELLTRAQIIEALGYNGLHVKAPTFRSWIHREYLKPEDYRANGTPLYRLKAALDLARNPETMEGRAS